MISKGTGMLQYTVLRYLVHSQLQHNLINMIPVENMH